MTTQEYPTKLVCCECIGDKFLADEVKKAGPSGLCGYCGETRESQTLVALANRIHEVLQEHFKLTSLVPEGGFQIMMFLNDGWEREGDSVDDVIAKITGLGERVVLEIKSLMARQFSYGAVKNGEEDPYNDEARYEVREPDDQWNDFCNEIRSKKRFFNTNAETILCQIFRDLTDAGSHGEPPAIRQINPEDDNRFVWRAREARSREELETILKSPVREMGPPPRKLPKGGRMNVPGIPVFYGGMDKSTCVAEVRALVGSHVVLAKFELFRTVHLLDLDALLVMKNEASYFDPRYAARKARAAFLQCLGREISRPVMPNDEALDYLPTQVLAEYLGSKEDPKIDGIIYSSSQAGDGSLNLVFFNHACGVEPNDPPQESEVYIDKACDGSFFVYQNDLPGQAFLAGPDPYSLGYPDGQIHEPTLRLDLNSVFVMEVKGLKYNTIEHQVGGYGDWMLSEVGSGGLKPRL